MGDIGPVRERYEVLPVGEPAPASPEPRMPETAAAEPLRGRRLTRLPRTTRTTRALR